MAKRKVATIWCDESSYSQSDKERKPNCYALSNNGIKISVHRNIYAPNKWHVSCFDLRMSAIELKGEDIHDAKAEAIVVVHARADEVRNAVEEMHRLHILGET